MSRPKQVAEVVRKFAEVVAKSLKTRCGTICGGCESHMLKSLKSFCGSLRNCAEVAPYTTYRACARLGGGAAPLTQQVSA